MATVKRVKNTIILKEGILRSLYGNNVNESNQIQRYENLYDEFEKQYNESPTDFVSSSGRTEICGNHTDHNNGKVLVGAITCDTLAACKSTTKNQVVVSSIGYPEIVVDLNSLEKVKREEGSSFSLVKGVLSGMKNAGYHIGGANLKVTSNVFKGVGVSSSASFEVLICEVMNIYYNAEKIPPIEKAKISQYAENVYFGKPCGLLDQAGIALGSLSAMDFTNGEKPITEVVDFDFSGYSLVITNTGGDHSNLTREYAAIREEMQAVASSLNKSVLREVDENEFYKNLSMIRLKTSDRAVLRAKHFFDENRRVERALQALKDGDVFRFFDQVARSGRSSTELLQNCYVSGAVSQPILLGVALSKRIIRDKGATRVHGGGFAGTVLAFVPNRLLGTYLETMNGVFGEDNVFVTSIRRVGTTKVNK